MDEHEHWRRLIQGLQQGDAQIGREFWEQYGPILQRLADKHLAAWLRRRVDPDDVVQSACRTFFRHLQEGDYQLPDGQSLLYLLCAITLNKVLKQARFHQARKRDLRREAAPARDRDGSPAAFEPVDPEPSPVEAAEFAEHIQRFLTSLDDEERRLVDLKLQGRSNQEIAELLHRTDRWVRKLFEGLRTRLARMGEVS